MSLDKQLSAAVATQTALGIQSQSSGAINAATPALDQQLKASVQAQSEAEEKSQMPKWEQNKRPEKEMTEDQKLESLLDPGAAQFQEQVGGGVLTAQQPIQALSQAEPASNGLLIDQLYGPNAPQALNQATEAGAATPDIAKMLAAAQQEPVQPLTDMVVPSAAANSARLGLSGLANMAQSLGEVAGSQPNLAVAENAAAADAAMATASVAQELNVAAPDVAAAAPPVEAPKAVAVENATVSLPEAPKPAE